MTDCIKREDALELFEMVLESYKDAGIQNIKTMVAIAPQEFHMSEDDEIADFNFELDGWRNNFMEIESADVAPVRHGHWIFNQDEMSLHCSYCDEVFRFEDAEKDECLDFMEYAKYCLACGTRMDGDEDDD